MEYKPYEEYKDVDLPWLDRVPSHWEMEKVKYKFDLVKEPSSDENPTVLSLTQKGIKVRNIESNEGQLAKSYEGYNTIKKGYICLNPMDLESGAAAKSEYEGVISNAYFTIKPKFEDINTDFYSKYFNLHYKKKIFYGFGKGVGRPEGSGGRWTLNRETFINFPIIFPPKEEQDKIVEFLDYQIEKIDRFIDLRERQIALFEEEKEVLINNAVTKGIDKTVSYKDSGVDWLGEIPEHWEVIRLKYVSTSIKTGGTPQNFGEHHLSNNGIEWYSPGDFNDRLILTGANRKLSKEGQKLVNIFQKNSVLIVGIGGTLGKVGLSKESFSCNQQINVITPRFDLMDANFLLYFLYSHKNDISGRVNYTTLPILNQEDTKNLTITLPPISEQESIVVHIEKETSKIDKTIDLYKKQIDLIKEYRTSLISHAVTGKIDVRNFQEVK